MQIDGQPLFQSTTAVPQWATQWLIVGREAFRSFLGIQCWLTNSTDKRCSYSQNVAQKEESFEGSKVTKSHLVAAFEDGGSIFLLFCPIL